MIGSSEISSGESVAAELADFDQIFMQICREVLRRPVALNDNFLDLGGNSLQALQVVVRVRALLNVELPLRILFEAPALSECVTHIRKKHAGLERKSEQASVPSPTDVTSSPVSPSQLRFWLLEKMEPNNAAIRVPAIFRFCGTLNVPALEEALRQFAVRHALLRTSYFVQGNEVWQKINAEPEQTILHISAKPAAEPNFTLEETVLRAVGREINQPLDLQNGPVWSTRLFQLHEQEHILACVFHHIASDGWSLGLFYREISLLYNALTRGEKPALPELTNHGSAENPNSFRTRETRVLPSEGTSELEKCEAFWREQLAGASPHLSLPFRNASDFSPSQGEVLTTILPAEITTLLRELNRRESATMFMTLLAAFQTLLFRHSGQEDFLIGVPTAGRTCLEMENIFGCFLNTLAFRANFSEMPDFRTLLQRVKETTWAALEHQSLPVEKQLQNAGITSAPGHSPFTVLYNHLNFSEDRLQLSGVTVHRIHLPQTGVNADLELYSRETHNGLALQLAYRSASFDRQTAETILRQLVTLLDSLTKNPDERVSRLALTSKQEQGQQHSDYLKNFPTSSFAELHREEIEQSIPARFEKQVQRAPNQIAVHMPRSQWTYERLNREADRIAHALLISGNAGSERVALLLEHDAPMLAAIFGVLKAGKTYVPLHTSHPEARLSTILHDSGASALITENAFVSVAKNLVGTNCRLLNIDDLKPIDTNVKLPLTISPDAPAYLLYTSGSTGAPKGVVQNHRNVLHFIRVYTNNLHLHAQDRLTLIPSYAHDAAVMDIFGALLNGASLILQDVRRENPRTVMDVFQQSGATVFHSTPTVYRHLVGSLQPSETLPNIRLVVLGGEEVKPNDVELFRKHFDHDCIFVNGLGPTECTIALQNFLRPQTSITGHSIPVGYPVDETEIWLLDERGMKTDFCGEIGIRSRHLALGYWNQPALTQERFLPDPDGGDRRIYRTGDMARQRPDGMFEFTGRNDRQIKIRGFRVELREIEHALRACPGIKDAFVIPHENLPSDRCLVACVVKESTAALTTNLCRRHLQSRLPDYMIPSAFVLLEKSPMTASGKLDYAALPLPVTSEDDFTFQASESGPPQTVMEMELLQIWRQLFERKDIGRSDNFFELGGHSLLAVRLIAEMEKRTSCPLTTSLLFQAPTVESLALRLAEKSWTPRWTSLVSLQPQGSRPSVYFVHGWGGEVFNFFPLAQRLGPDQPAHGLRAIGLDGKQARHTTVEQMAAHYLGEIRSFQPNGPYHLAGYSAGGVIAYEMAQQLHRQGQKVGMLALIDTLPLPVPTAMYLHSLLLRFPQRLRHHFTQWRQNKQPGGLLPQLQRGLKYWLGRNRSEETMSPSGHSTTLGYPDYYVAVARAYKLLPYPGAIDLFTCDSTNLHLMKFWDRLAMGGVHRHNVAGAHEEILDARHLESFSQIFSNALQNAQAKHATLIS